MYFITKVPTIKGIDSIDSLLEVDWGRDDLETVGYFKQLEDAERAIEEGRIDSFIKPKGYVVIEKIGEGIFQRSKTIKWYKYNDVTEKYRIVNNVESVIVNFAEIG